jgi:hypothetical protein
LLAGNLKDQRPEGIEGRKLVHPRPRAKVGPCLDQPRKNQVRLSKKVACIGIGRRALRAGCGIHGHSSGEHDLDLRSASTPTYASGRLAKTTQALDAVAAQHEEYRLGAA